MSFLIVFSGLLFAEEMEVRSYQVGERLFFQVYHQNTDFGDPFGGDEGRGIVLKKAPFESRFFEEAGELKDCSKEMGQLLNEKEWKGRAVLDVNDGELVVKAEGRDHRAIAEIFEEMLGGQTETEVLIYRVKGVSLARRAREVIEVKEKGELLAGLSFLSIPGMSGEARKGGFLMKVEAQWDQGFDVVESRLHLNSTLDGAEFELKTGFATVRGVPMLVELGSLDGKDALVAVLTMDRVLFNGVKFDEWILKEKDGAFLREERLAPVEKVAELEVKGVRKFKVNPTFVPFISTASEGGDDEKDPFAVDGESEPGLRKEDLLYRGDHPELAKVPRRKLYDVTTLLKMNGVSFEEGEFAVFSEPSLMLLVKASPTNLELVDGITVGGSDPPRFVRLDFVQVESADEIDGGSLEEGRFRIRKKIGVDAVPGQVAKVKVGKKLTLEAETQIDGNNELIEMRATLSERGNLEEASLKTGLTLQAGKPVVVQQSRRGEKWVAWVATAEVITIGKDIE